MPGQTASAIPDAWARQLRCLGRPSRPVEMRGHGTPRCLRRATPAPSDARARGSGCLWNLAARPDPPRQMPALGNFPTLRVRRAPACRAVPSIRWDKAGTRVRRWSAESSSCRYDYDYIWRFVASRRWAAYNCWLNGPGVGGRVVGWTKQPDGARFVPCRGLHWKATRSGPIDTLQYL